MPILSDGMLLRPSIPKRTLDLVATSSSSTASTTFTFSTVSLGDPASTREIFVTVTLTNATQRTVSSASIGGVSASVLYTNYARNAGVSVLRATVPSGTTGNISITMNGNTAGCGIAVYRVTNRGSAGETGIYSSATLDGLSATSVSLGSINVPKDGFVLSAISRNGSASGTTFSGIGTMTTDLNTANNAHGSSDLLNAAVTGGSVSISWTTSRLYNSGAWAFQ